MAVAKTTASKKTRSTTTRKKTSSIPPPISPTKSKTTKTATKGKKKNNKLLNNSQETKENRCITEYFPVISRRRLALAKAEDEYRQQIINSIDSCKDPIENLIITEFEDKGKGVIASSVIGKGNFVCEYAGDLINLDEAKVSSFFCILVFVFKCFALVMFEYDDR